MNDFSLVEKISLLMNLIVSSPHFLFCSMKVVMVLIIFIICIKKEKKVNKWIFISIWIILGLILLINYNSIVLSLINSLFDSIFMALYFPSIGVYITILLITNFCFIYTLFNKKVRKSHKIINFVSALIIDLFLLLVVDIVEKNNINMYDELTIYTNSNLLVLLELTSSIFVSNILLNLLASAHTKLKKFDKQELPKMPEIIFEEI